MGRLASTKYVLKSKDKHIVVILERVVSGGVAGWRVAAPSTHETLSSREEVIELLTEVLGIVRDDV